MAIREGRWDCPHCGSRGIFGRHKICGNCGSPRPEGIAFYLADIEEEVTEQSLLATAKAGADWICDYCGASNLATATDCKQCFAPKSADARTQAVRTLGASREPTALPATGVSPRAFIAIALVGLALFACAYFAFFRTSSETAIVADKGWERTVEILALQPVQREGWALPDDARLISEREALYETRQVKVGDREYVCDQRDLGNGFFEDVYCTEPIYREETEYRTEYTYELDEWQVIRTEAANGVNGITPFWPAFTLTTDERQGEQGERYTLTLDASNGERYSIGLPLSRWEQYAIGDTVNIEINAIGGVSIRE
ncbi:MAG: hypothetical protein H6638_03295 [Ardenticatenales bacterium]|nr:hypothetical protein [Ardenticatenales bacterium]MCB9171474.1 hypothetical protein [Ardenticatenales bacterium]